MFYLCCFFSLVLFISCFYIYFLFFFTFFFFKQKTAYEMRISDWSSDVCSSDLPDEALLRATKVVEDCRANGSPRPVVRAFFDEPSSTVSYVVHDPETRAAAIIDSVLDFDVASGRTAYGTAQALIAYVTAEG